MRILGIDPGFAYLGVCMATLDEEEGLVFRGAITLQTKRDPDKHAAVDLFDRCRSLALSLPTFGPYDVVAIEGYTYPPTSQAAVKLGASHGVIAAVVALTDSFGTQPEVVITSPQQARKFVIPGPKVPKEEDVHAKLLHDHPSLDEVTRDLAKSRRVHALDAAVQVFAALERIRMSDAI